MGRVRRLYQCDNLDVLRGIDSETVDLIATDPPFNKGRDFHSTPGALKGKTASFQDRWSWEKDVHDEWVDQIKDDWPGVWHVIFMAKESYGDDMGAFLCFLGVRLIVCWRVLKPTGSIYVQCDPTASHYIKMLMDAVFGKKNFRNEIVWCYTGPSNTKRWFPRKHDIILYYVKGSSSIFHADAVRVPYDKETLARRGRVEGARSIISPSVNIKGKRSIEQVTDSFGKGKIPEDWWNMPSLTNQREKTCYPTQKPLALYERIIKASSNPGDLVLDPFCGCATTCIAAERLGRSWIGIDIWDGTKHVTAERLANEGILEIDGEHRGDILTPKGRIEFSTKPPERTDGGAVAVPYLKPTMRPIQDSSPRIPRKELLKMLIERDGERCQGCDRTFDDTAYLEIDHKLPRADGGENAPVNRCLLCGPCNRRKAHRLTLSGLRMENKKAGFMAG